MVHLYNLRGRPHAFDKDLEVNSTYGSAAAMVAHPFPRRMVGYGFQRRDASNHESLRSHFSMVERSFHK